MKTYLGHIGQIRHLLLVGAIVGGSFSFSASATAQEVVYAPINPDIQNRTISVSVSRFLSKYAGRRLDISEEEEEALTASNRSDTTSILNKVFDLRRVRSSTKFPTFEHSEPIDFEVRSYSQGVAVLAPKLPNVADDNTSEFIIGVKARDAVDKNKKFTVIHGDAASWGPIPLQIKSGKAPEPAETPNPTEQGSSSSSLIKADDVLVSLDAQFTQARAYPSLVPIHSLVIDTSPFKSEFGSQQVGDIKDKDKIILRDKTGKDISDIIQSVETEGNKVYVLIDQKVVDQKQEAFNPGAEIWVGIEGTKVINGQKTPVNFLKGNAVGNPDLIKVPTYASGEFQISAAQAKNVVVGKVVDLTGEEVVVKSEDKRDLWRFKITGKNPSVFSAYPARGFNSYLSWDLLISELARDPESRIDVRYGIERSLGVRNKTTRFIKKAWDTRAFAELGFQTHQSFENKVGLISVGAETLLPKPFEKFSTPILPVSFSPKIPSLRLEVQTPFNLGNNFIGDKQRLHADLKWDVDIAQPIFPDAKAKFYSSLQGWRFFGQGINNPYARAQKLRNVSRIELGLQVPTSNKQKNDSGTFVQIAYINGRNESSGFQTTRGFQFSVINK